MTMRKPYLLLTWTAALLVSFICAPATAQVTFKQFVDDCYVTGMSADRHDDFADSLIQISERSSSLPLALDGQVTAARGRGSRGVPAPPVTRS
jgi:hypothetical protein